MEFDDNQEYSLGGSDPSIVGAIFMANCRTKTECLNRKLFGLPPSQANFVKRVKSGMMLFLFEFEERKLYGVFQAVSDGAMNIVPNAFKSSGKQIPAQIRIKTIWYCKPLSEYEFRGAIEENYFAPYKFNLGLSKDQVANLLGLFESRKINIQRDKNLSLKELIKKSESPLSERRSNPLSERRFKKSLPKEKPIKKSKSPLSKEYITNRSVSSDCVLGDNEDIPSDCDKPRLAVVSETESMNNYYGSSRSNSYLSVVSEKPDSSYSSAPFPSSKSRVIPFLVPTENISLPPMRPGSLDLVPSSGDYIPLESANYFDPIDSSRPSPQSVSTRYNSVNPANLEVYDILSFSDPALNTNPLRHVPTGRDDLILSFGPGKDPPYVPDYYRPAVLHDPSSPGKDPPYVPDYHCPANLGREGPPDSAFQPSPSAGTFFPYKSNLQVRDHSLDSQRKTLEQNKQTSVERDVNGAHGGLRSDIPCKRTSVFSRLNGCPKDLAQDDKKHIGTKDHVHKTVKQLMDMLSECQKRWRKSTRKYEDNSKGNDVDDKIESEITLSELDDAPLDIEDQECIDVVAEEPVVNFKRRSKIRKMHREMEHRVEETDGLSHTCLPKRRKLLRPSFVSVGTHECKEGGSSEVLAAGNGHEGDKNDSYQYFGVPIVVESKLLHQNIGKPQNYEVKEGASVKSFISSNGSESIRKDLSQNIGVQVVGHTNCSERNSGKTDIFTNSQDEVILDPTGFKGHRQGGTEDSQNCWGDGNEKAQDTKISYEDGNENTEETSGSMELEKLVNTSSECEGNIGTEELFPKSNVFQTNFLHGGEDNKKVSSGRQGIVQALHSGPSCGKTDPSNSQDFIQDLNDIKDHSHLSLHDVPKDVSVCRGNENGESPNRQICCEDVSSKAQDSQICWEGENGKAQGSQICFEGANFERDSVSRAFEKANDFFPESNDSPGNPSIGNSDVKLKRKEMCEDVGFSKTVDNEVIDLNLSIGGCYNHIS
ncbi:B2 protein [Thalictrum thalictroides]|uniref:B2 protein n=1 Tax=Thalictrum thalictroides TaxID=46969 RepID=A0A7J6W001_THATH|nr:B2 protein [Thalictrum thalictroides]